MVTVPAGGCLSPPHEINPIVAATTVHAARDKAIGRKKERTTEISSSVVRSSVLAMRPLGVAQRPARTALGGGASSNVPSASLVHDKAFV